MHLYHFDLIDSASATDVSTAMLDDDEQARKLAAELALAVREGRSAKATKSWRETSEVMKGAHFRRSGHKIEGGFLKPWPSRCPIRLVWNLECAG
jgi:hypothetical protein